MQKQLRMLVVDDDEIDRMAVRRTLSRVREDLHIDEATDKASGNDFERFG